MTDIDDFIKLLRSYSLSFSEKCEQIGERPGFRLMKLSGDFIRFVLSKDLGASFVNELLVNLPPDVVILDHDGTLIRMIPAFAADGSGIHQDEYSIVFMSKHWEPIEEGAVFPLMPSMALDLRGPEQPRFFLQENIR